MRAGRDTYISFMCDSIYFEILICRLEITITELEGLGPLGRGECFLSLLLSPISTQKELFCSSVCPFPLLVPARGGTTDQVGQHIHWARFHECADLLCTRHLGTCKNAESAPAGLGWA